MSHATAASDACAGGRSDRRGRGEDGLGCAITSVDRGGGGTTDATRATAAQAS